MWIISKVEFLGSRGAPAPLQSRSHLFDDNTTVIAVRRGHYLRGFAYRFIELCEPSLTEPAVRAAISPARDSDIA